MHKHLHRPSTLLNFVLRNTIGRLPVKHGLSSDDLSRWREGSRKVFNQFLEDPSVLDRADEVVQWYISDDIFGLQDDAWSLEVCFDGDSDPIVRAFNSTLWTRVPVSRAGFYYLGQTAVDHAYGHLCGFYEGGDFGEERACVDQWRAACHREGAIWRTISQVIPVVHYYHKRIPTGLYR